MSSLLTSSAFDPSGNYFVSGITALDTAKIRVQSTNSTSSLASAFQLDKGQRVTCLSWGLFSLAGSNLNKKRKVIDSPHIENQFVSVGLNDGSILIYSPLSNEIIGTFENPHSSSINDFHFSNITNSGWSIDVNQNIIEWDLNSYKLKTQFKFNEILNSITIIEHDNKPHILAASQKIFLIDIETQEVVKSFPGHISSVHTLLPISSDNFITAAEGDRFINIYSLSDQSNSSVLVTESSVISLAYNNNVLSAVTEDGVVEIFDDALSKPVKATKRGQQSKKSSGKVELKRPSEVDIKIENSFVKDDFLTITWLEDGSIPYFERVRVEDVQESKVIHKSRPSIQAKDHSLFGQDVAAPKRYNESQATITSGDNLRYLDNKEVEVEAEVEEDLPSLAEKFLQSNPEPSKKKRGRATPGSSAVVLIQALRANDHALLETVLSNKAESFLKNTIERLDTSLAVILLERLAERIARNTHRQGELNKWVKWVIVIHGGYLVNVGNLSNSLSSLHSTLSRRSATLTRLLKLQSRLEILFSQQEVLQNQAEEEYYGSDESDVEYIEELDDAHLIDDGEADYDDISIGDDSSSFEDSADEKEEINEQEEETEEGYSDVEVNGDNDEETSSESDHEQEQLRQRIARLRTKQGK